MTTAGVAASSGAAATSSGMPTFVGDAYATRAKVGSTINSGPTSLVALGCSDNADVLHTNTLASLNVPTVLSTGVLDTSIATTATPSTVTTADVHDLNVLDGLITATEVKSVSTTSKDASGFHLSSAGSTFANLVVAGVPITVTPAPNTTIALLGVGTVVLNEQIAETHQKAANLTVNMIHVHATLLNGDIVVAHAKSGLGKPVQTGLLGGHAYATKADVAGGLLISGPTALVGIPCLSTKGNVHTNTLVGITIPGILSSGTATDTAQGMDNSTAATAATTSTIQALNVLSGLVTADVVKAAATATKPSGGTVTLSDAGSSLANLTVAGVPIAADTHANTKITLAGLTVWIHRVIKTGGHNIEVRMIEIVVNGTNTLGLSLGTDIRVAVASAAVH